LWFQYFLKILEIDVTCRQLLRIFQRIMITRIRMKLDLGAQSLGLAALLITVALSRQILSGTLVLAICMALQLLSAWQLWSLHRLRPARTFLAYALPLLATLPFWYYVHRLIPFALLLLLVLIYYGKTIRHTLIVLRRPRRFWDLG
jgi:hypothetical protein